MAVMKQLPLRVLIAMVNFIIYSTLFRLLPKQQGVRDGSGKPAWRL
jgi:hypothetical protein